MYDVNFDICDFNNREVIALAGGLHYKGADFFDYHRKLDLKLGKALNLPALASFMILSECAKLGVPLAQAHRVMGGVVHAVVIECGIAQTSWKSAASSESASIVAELSCRTESEKKAFIASVLGLEARAIRRFLYSADQTVDATDDPAIIFDDNESVSLKIIDARAIAKAIMNKHRRAFFGVVEYIPSSKVS
jgi:hypothetical protein